MKIKKIISAALSAAIFSVSSTVAFAQDNAPQVSSQELIRVGEYDCYVENGQYFTELDGEKCLVINLDDYVSAASSTQNVSNNSGYDWLDDLQEVHLSYSGTVDVSNGNFTTPVFLAKQKEDGNYSGFQISTGFWLNTTYTADVYFYNCYVGVEKWECAQNVDLTFNLIAQTRILFTGTMVNFYKKACLVFHQVEPGHSDPVFNYTMYSCG